MTTLPPPRLHPSPAFLRDLRLWLSMVLGELAVLYVFMAFLVSDPQWVVAQWVAQRWVVQEWVAP